MSGFITQSLELDDIFMSLDRIRHLYGSFRKQHNSLKGKANEQ